MPDIGYEPDMKRNIENQLQDWQSDSDRKTLLMRGARQVGKTCRLDQEVDEPFHRRLLETLRAYWLVGGMPAAVEAYRTKRDLRQCQFEIDTLITSIQDDFAKYKKKANVSALRDVFFSMVQQTGTKFKYANVSSESKTYHYKNALELLAPAAFATMCLEQGSGSLRLTQDKENYCEVLS